MTKLWQKFVESGKPGALPIQTQECLPIRDYHVAWSWEFSYDVVDIADYIELRFGRDRSDRFIDEIDAEGETISREFRMYTGRGIYYRKKLILKKLLDPSIIFTLLMMPVRLFMIRVLRDERNWQKKEVQFQFPSGSGRKR